MKYKCVTTFHIIMKSILCIQSILYEHPYDMDRRFLNAQSYVFSAKSYGAE